MKPGWLEISLQIVNSDNQMVYRHTAPLNPETNLFKFNKYVQKFLEQYQDWDRWFES